MSNYAQSAITAASIARPLHPAVVAACAPIIDLDFRSVDAVPAGVVRGASGKWVCGPTGALSLIPAGTPPIDHDPATGSVRGLRIEGAATNPVTAGEDAAAWALNDVVVVSGATTSVTGRPAAKIAAGTTNAYHYLQPPAISGLSAGARIASVWAKAGERYWLQLDILTPGYGDYLQTRFDLRNGQASIIAQSAAATSIGGGAIYYPGGWWRLWVAASLPGTTAMTNLYLLGPDGAQQHAGDGASGLYFGGLQIDTAGTYPSSYIPASIPTTRAADLADLALATVPGWNSAEWTICMELMLPSLTPGIQRHAVTLHDGGAQNGIRLGWMDGSSDGSAIGVLAVVGGVNVANMKSAGIVSAGVPIRIASSLDAAGRLAQSVNGGAPISQTPASRPTTTTLALGGRDNGTEPLNGWLRRVTVFPRSRPDATLQLLSGG